VYKLIKVIFNLIKFFISLLIIKVKCFFMRRKAKKEVYRYLIKKEIPREIAKEIAEIYVENFSFLDRKITSIDTHTKILAAIKRKI